jgi:DtxR family transcriptional regulator, Mn-dependent transcriptional regulator
MPARKTPRATPAASKAAHREPPATLTAPVEDYLKAVYDLEQSGAAVSTTALAERLVLAPASISGMVRRLAEQGLVNHEPYRGVTLTHAGRRGRARD